MLNMIGYCDHHFEDVTPNMFEWKGCWSCYHFKPADDFPYVDVAEASYELGVSKSTVIRWIKKGKLEGWLFERGRHLTEISPPHKKYFISFNSFEDMKKQRQTK